MYELRKFFKDILKDNNSTKYSMTKFGALIGYALLTILVIVALKIMITKNEIDHVLIVEVIGFILTILGFKNNFGFTKNAAGEQQIKITNEGTNVDMNITTTDPVPVPVAQKPETIILDLNQNPVYSQTNSNTQDLRG
jgi:hypothetical protein